MRMAIFADRTLNRRVLDLAWPAIVEQLFQMMLGIVGMAMVGHISKEALAAVGMANQIVVFFSALFAALATGATVLVARLIGEGRNSDANEAARQALLVGSGASVLASIVVFLCPMQIIKLFFGNAEMEVIIQATSYFKILATTFPMFLIMMIIGGILRGAGDTKTPMVATGFINVINVVLSYILIFGIPDFTVLGFTLGVPGLALQGAAIATAFARAVGGFYLLAVLFRGNHIIKLSFQDNYRVNKIVVKKILNIGTPAALEQLLMQGGFLVFAILIAGLGSAAFAAHQVGITVMSLAFMPGFGFALAATSLVGQSLGSANPQQAEKSAWIASWMATLVMALAGVIIFVFAYPLVDLFTEEREVVIIGSTIIRILAFTQPFLAISMVLAGALRGAGDTKTVTLVSFIGIWVFRIIIGYFLINAGYGINGAWAAIAIDQIVRTAFFIFWFQRGKWKEICI